MDGSAADMTRMQSPAKINWTLGVLGKRADGFHEIASLVSLVTLYDEVEFAECDGPEGSDIVLECDVPGIPTDDQNLVVRATRLIASAARRPGGLRCRLTKRIPAGGGLGGGSSNAAATLVALNERWNLGLNRAALAELGARLGSDVPLFLAGGSAVIGGRGERVEGVRLPWRGWIVLLMPGLSVATAAVYRAWRSCGRAVPPVMPEAAENATAWMNGTFNMLEEPAFEVCPELARLCEQSAALAGRPVRVSGSGSTMFTAFDGRDEALAFAGAAEQRLGIRTRVVQPVEQA